MANAAARASTKSAFAPEGAWLSVAMLNLVSADGGTMGYQMASASLAPVFALQGRHVQRVTPRLPEPPGPRTGCEGAGPELRLLLLGDSAAAGVGAASQDEALSGRLVGALAATFRVSWTLVARTGATTAGTARHLARRRVA